MDRSSVLSSILMFADPTRGRASRRRRSNVVRGLALVVCLALCASFVGFGAPQALADDQVHGWTGSFGSASLRDIAVDGLGNAYVTGGFVGTADLDPGPGTFNLTSRGGLDAFVSKVDGSGNFVWARSFGKQLPWGE